MGRLDNSHTVDDISPNFARKLEAKYPYAYRYAQNENTPIRKTIKVWESSMSQASKMVNPWDTATVTFIRAVQIFKETI